MLSKNFILSVWTLQINCVTELGLSSLYSTPKLVCYLSFLNMKCIRFGKKAIFTVWVWMRTGKLYHLFGTIFLFRRLYIRMVSTLGVLVVCCFLLDNRAVKIGSLFLMLPLLPNSFIQIYCQVISNVSTIHKGIIGKTQNIIAIPTWKNQNVRNTDTILLI